MAPEKAYEGSDGLAHVGGRGADGVHGSGRVHLGGVGVCVALMWFGRGDAGVEVEKLRLCLGVGWPIRGQAFACSVEHDAAIIS